ncbi:MAG: sensor domain-containing diguanylate cyclase [Chloroflexota bacterium]
MTGPTQEQSNCQPDSQQAVQDAKQQTARALKALNQATAALLTTLDLETLLGRILDAAISAIPVAEKGCLYLIARDTGKLEMRAVLGYTETDPRIQKLTRTDEKSNIYRVVQEHAPLLLQFEDSQAAFQSKIAAPLILNDHILGAISLEASPPLAFNRDDLDLLASFAATATAAIHNAQLHAEVQKLAITDDLTSLYNRRGLSEIGEREVARALRFGRPLAALLMDLDNLKPINDQYGHAAGDCLLRFVAEQINIYTRKVDILCRYGGDEFVILLPENDLFDASNVAERLRAQIAQASVAFEGNQLTTSVSIGISKVTADTPDLETLLKRADSALYVAKQSGKNQVVIR